MPSNKCDDEYSCAMCRELVEEGRDLLVLEHGETEYDPKRDFSYVDTGDTKYMLCTCCTQDAFLSLIHEEEEYEEIAIQFGLDAPGSDVSEDDWFGQVHEIRTGDSPPLTWFRDHEPDTCCRCRCNLDTGLEKTVQVSVVTREGKKYSDPVPHYTDKIRFTYFCQTCVETFYAQHQEVYPNQWSIS
jgi:hypothetical protein